MTLETGSESESKQDQEKDQKGTSGTQPGQQPEEDHQNALEHFPAAAAHSTPLKSEKASVIYFSISSFYHSTIFHL